MIVILSVSDWEKHFVTAQEEYKKRLWKTILFDTIKPIKNLTINQTIQQETLKIKSRIHSKYKNFFKILLNAEWKQIDSIWFSKFFINYENILFIIGGAYWLDYNYLKHHYNFFELSFWKMTMPHWLIKLVLLEQIYRSFCILKNKKYHY